MGGITEAALNFEQKILSKAERPKKLDISEALKNGKLNRYRNPELEKQYVSLADGALRDGDYDTALANYKNAAVRTGWEGEILQTLKDYLAFKGSKGLKRLFYQLMSGFETEENLEAKIDDYKENLKELNPFFFIPDFTKIYSEKNEKEGKKFKYSLKDIREKTGLKNGELREFVQYYGLKPRYKVDSDELVSIVYVYNSLNDEGRRLTNEEIENKTLRSTDTIYRTLHKAEERGIEVDWKKKKKPCLHLVREEAA